ncbi:MAG: fibronectin type III domain-containing protein [Ignavibacteriales bacterium]|nr:fibronectin type III domain-containing protein [Ignavibacteriales bacterium]
MKKFIFKIMLIIIPLIISVVGCVDSLNSTDKLPPSVSVYKPATSDTISVDTVKISYTAFDDQELSSISVVLNGIFQNSFNAKENVHPEVYFVLDSTFVSQQISYYLIAYDVAGNSKKSNEMTGIYIVKQLSKPTFLKLEIKSKLHFTLTWDYIPSNELGYEIHRKEGQTGVFNYYKTIPAGTRSYDVVETNDKKIYYYKVRAYNKYGYSNFTNQVSSIGDPPQAPTGLTAISTGTKTVKLTWRDNSNNETSFLLQRKWAGDESPYINVATINPDISEYIDTKNITAGTGFQYRICAQIDTLKSNWSNEVQVTTLTEDIFTPTNLSASFNPTSKSVVLTWVDNNANDLYTRIFRKKDSDLNFGKIDSVGSGKVTYSDNNISAGNYSYKVQVYTNGGNTTEFSNIAQLDVPVIPPNAPSNLSLSQLSDKVFNLEWNDNSDDETRFELWRKDGNADFRTVKYLSPNTIRCNDAISDTTLIYFYKVRSVRDNEPSDFSNLVNSTGGISTYPRPTKFTAIALCPTQIKLSWQNNAVDALKLILERKLSQWGTYSKIAELLPDVQQYIDKEGISAGIEFYYRIKALSASDESDFSDEAKALTPSSGNCP